MGLLDELYELIVDGRHLGFFSKGYHGHFGQHF